MARATRSSTQKQPEMNPRSKIISKKRKRLSAQHDKDQPVSKQIRTDQDESTSEPEIISSHFQFARDLPIDSSDSQKILDVLESVDTPGLLERVFPLSTDSSASQLYSLKTLLNESSRHPLSVLRSAVHHLLPISSHPRARPSSPAAQQLRFCNLALSLLDQASHHSVQIPLELESILPPPPPHPNIDPDVNGDSKPPRTATTESPPLSPVRNHRFALLQRLSSGDWWTSLNSNSPLLSLASNDLKGLPTAHAELVAIMPSPSASSKNDVTSSKAPAAPTLGSYTTKCAPVPKSKLPAPRYVSCGTFLDYGPYSTFAPTFDQDGVEINRTVLGEVVWEKEERRRRKGKQRPIATIVETPEPSADVIMADDTQDPSASEATDREKVSMEIEHALNGLFLPDQVTMIKSALGSLELENAVHELLERNRKALMRLEELQSLRLSGKAGSSSTVTEGSEEWDTAQEIMNSLILLTSLRPRPSSDKLEVPPLIPPAFILQRLQQTLPLEPSRGWHGTLPSTRSTALRDDSTLRVRAGGTTLPSNGTNPIPATTATTSAPNAAATTPAGIYPAYSYSAYTAQYRAGYTPYKPGQTPAYYPAGYTPATAGGAAATQGQTATPTYYGNQAYNATGQQQQYSYGSWYNYQPPAGGGASSGRGTPQPATVAAANPSSTSSAVPMNYAGFFNSVQQPAGQRAVANTAVAAKSTATATPYVPPTYTRGATSEAGTPQPGTPGAVTGYSFAQPTLSTAP